MEGAKSTYGDMCDNIAVAKANMQGSVPEKYKAYASSSTASYHQKIAQNADGSHGGKNLAVVSKAVFPG